MAKKKDGGPAFPLPENRHSCGMTLRDYLAGQALAGILTIDMSPADDDLCKNFADDAYAFADAMLKERET